MSAFAGVKLAPVSQNGRMADSSAPRLATVVRRRNRVLEALAVPLALLLVLPMLWMSIGSSIVVTIRRMKRPTR